MTTTQVHSNPTLPSYIDFDTLLAPDFSPYSFANRLVISTNNPTDTPLDLATPLSRVLFDVQEVDTLIHDLTTKSAIPIIQHTKTQSDAAKRILEGAEKEVARLAESYQRLEREVIGRYQDAEKASIQAERSLAVLELGRNVQRLIGLARQIESSITDSKLGVPGQLGKEDHRLLLRATHACLDYREMAAKEDMTQLQRVSVVQNLQRDVFRPAEDKISSWASRAIREFSMSSLANTGGQNTTYTQTEDAKLRTTSAVQTLYLLSSISVSNAGKSGVSSFEPDLLLKALRNYLHNNLTSSSAAIARALSQLPMLEKTLLEVSARCQNILALEILLRSIKPPPNPLLNHQARHSQEDSEEPDSNLLQPLLHSLDTSSLPSYFWRTLASSLSPRVEEILRNGGVSARTLRSNKDRVREEIRKCVLKASQTPAGIEEKDSSSTQVGNWEREAAVMVGSIVGLLGR